MTNGETPTDPPRVFYPVQGGNGLCATPGCDDVHPVMTCVNQYGHRIAVMFNRESIANLLAHAPYAELWNPDTDAADPRRQE